MDYCAMIQRNKSLLLTWKHDQDILSEKKASSRTYIFPITHVKVENYLFLGIS